MFMFTHVVTDCDTTLLQRILTTELPAVVANALAAYHGAVQSQGHRQFWSWCPQGLRDAQKVLARSSSLAQQYMSLAEDEDRPPLAWGVLMPVRKQGYSVALKALQAGYSNFVASLPREQRDRFKSEALDASTLTRMGFVIEEQVHCCHACARRTPRAVKCCDSYVKNRRVKQRALCDIDIIAGDAAEAADDFGV